MVKSYETGNKNLEALLEKRARFIEEYNEGQNPYYSRDEFIEDYRNITQEIQKGASSAYQQMNKIVDMVIKMHQEEVEQINKVIDKRKELLSQQKDAWNWDRTLKSKSNDLSMLEKQKKALDGLVDAESRARLQKINKQIADAREDLENTVKDHSIDLQVQGLDDLKTSLSNKLEELSKQAQSSVEEMTKVIERATDTVTNSMNRVDLTVKKMLDTLGVEGLDEVSVAWKPYMIPDYTGAQTYLMSDGTVLTPDNTIGGSISSNVSVTQSASDVVKDAKYIMPDLNAGSIIPVNNSHEHYINIGEVINQYTITNPTNSKEVMDVIQKNTKPIANAICEEIMHNVTTGGKIRTNWQ